VITYIKGDATKPIGDGPKIIAHICNNKGGWGRGFVLALSSRWKEPELEYRKWSKTSDFKLGEVQFVRVEPMIVIANMISQNGYFSSSNLTPICYKSLKRCLGILSVNAKYSKSSVHMPRIGTGLGGGDWVIIEKLIQDTLTDINVFVYDLKK